MKQSKESKAILRLYGAIGGINGIGKSIEIMGHAGSEDFAKESGKQLQKYADTIESAVKSLGIKVF